MLFVPKKSKEFTKDQQSFLVPDLGIGVLSDGTEKRDRGIKFKDYEKRGILEYWLVNAKNGETVSINFRFLSFANKIRFKDT